MATQPRLVNKQFNSPINLYSKQNVQDVLERETQILSNGAVGINFLNPSLDKPGNLKNSAVLRMLEEEENRQRNGFGPGNDTLARPLRENITWPPPEYEHKNVQRSTFKDVVTPGVKRVAWPPPSESGIDGPYSEQQQQQQQQQPQQQQPQYQAQQHSPILAKGGPQHPSQAPSGFQQTYQAPAQNSPRSPLKPLDVSQHGASPLASPIINQSPQGFRPATPSKGWAPVHSPVGTSTQPSWQQSTTRYQAAHQSVSQQTYLGQQYQSGFQQYQPAAQQYQPQAAPNQYQASPQQHQAPSQQYQAPTQQYQAPPQQYQAPPQQYQAPPQQFQHPPQQYQAPPQQYQAPPQQYQAPSQQNQAPPQQYQVPPQQYQASPQQYQASSQQYQASPQQYQASPQQNQASSQQFYSQSAPPQSIPNRDAAPTQVAPTKQAKPFEPPPTTITLRPQAPVSQAPAPLVTSQPATATLRGGKHLRGDLKWPPENVKHQMAEETRLRLELAQGPACRPNRPNKDYTGFFAQHALNSMYPGYKIPPGTQYYRPVE